MAVVAMVWELGSDMGHIARYRALAREFVRQGHRPVLILRDLARAHEVLGEDGPEYFQAPVWLTPIQGLPEPLNLSETLFRFGFLRPESLVSLALAWRSLWQLIRPDLLLFDQSPSALLAARGLPQPKVLIGNSFSVPAIGNPMPCFRWWENSRAQVPRLLDGEARLLRSLNQALTVLGAPLLESAGALFDVDLAMVLGRPQLDVYGTREPMPAHMCFRPPINDLDLGVEPTWPMGAGPKVFGYLKASFRHIEPLLDACRKSPARFLFFVPGISEQVRRRFESANLRFSSQPLRMRSVRESCDFCVTHAGGMTDVMLEAGKPLLLLPLHMEQTMTCRQAEMTGAALGFGVDRNPAELPKLLKRLLGETSLRDSALAYAAKYSEAAGDDPLRRVVMDCLKCLR